MEQKILNRIFVVRGQKVMLDEDLAEMYRVETRRLNEQVKRNAARFPHDFMFSLTQKEFTILKSQNATSSWGGRRKLPTAFSEQGGSKRNLRFGGRKIRPPKKISKALQCYPVF